MDTPQTLDGRLENRAELIDNPAPLRSRSDRPIYTDALQGIMACMQLKA